MSGAIPPINTTLAASFIAASETSAKRAARMNDSSAMALKSALLKANLKKKLREKVMTVDESSAPTQAYNSTGRVNEDHPVIKQIDYAA